MEREVHPAAVVSPSAVLGEGVRVAAGAVVEEGAVLGPGCVVEACAYVGPEVVLGPGCVVGVGAALLEGTRLGREVKVAPGAVLGTDGFGYVLDEGRHRKIPQVGRIEVGDRSTIGPGSCLDRATTGVTRIGEDTEVGSMVQIGHNVTIGSRTRIGDQTGITGSCRVGDDCEVGMQVGIAQRSEIGDRSRLADRSGALRRFPPDLDLAGYPARPRKEVERVEAALHRLPRLLEEFDRKKVDGPSPGGSDAEEGTR